MWTLCGNLCKTEWNLFTIDSHQTTGNNIGAVISMSSSFRFSIVEYVKVLNNVNCLLQLETLTWIEYMYIVHVKT